MSMATFGLSPLLLSLIAGNLFKYSEDELNVTGYTRFLAIFTMIINLLGAFTLDVKNSKGREVRDEDDNEETPLLRSTISLSDPLTPLGGILSDASFWVLAFIVAMTLGSVTPHLLDK
jgi:FtsH-binding integral membrane protein